MGQALPPASRGHIQSCWLLRARNLWHPGRGLLRRGRNFFDHEAGNGHPARVTDATVSGAVADVDRHSYFASVYALTVALDAAVPVVVGALVSCPDNRVDRHGTTAFGAVECDVPPFAGVVTVHTNVALVDYVEGGVVLGLYEDTVLNGTRTRVPISCQ